MSTASSPASTGSAGPHFEGQVGAYYLLSLLAGAQPRGLVNTRILRVELQRAAEGHPLDDVIVHAETAQGRHATFAIQVKRSLTFSPSDKEFRKVVSQIALTIRREGFWGDSYELGVAIARTSAKIDGAYQDVLSWARELDSATAFFARVNRKGSASDDMRRFVSTFRQNLANASAPHDDETLWRVLGRLQILPFDFTAVGSATYSLVLERAMHILHPEDSAKASALWSALVDLALQIASSGGDRTRERLLSDDSIAGFKFLGQSSYTTVRKALAESSRHALADIDTRVGTATLMRQERLDSVRDALDKGRYVEIRGASGVGKSGLLKLLAARLSHETQVVVLRANRIAPRGWAALGASLGFHGLARDLLIDIAADGGAIIFVDGLEGFSDEEQLTVKDLIREASQIAGISVIVTARLEFGSNEPSWIPSEAITRLSQSMPIVISELSDEEVEELAGAAPDLRALLADDHPARQIARNLYRLNRLLSQPTTDGPQPRTEVEMMDLWWQAADGRKDVGFLDRARLLNALAEQIVDRKQPLSTHGHPSAAVNALTSSETLQEISVDKVQFRHDVLREWAGAELLIGDPQALDRLVLSSAAPVYLSRSLELAARHLLERKKDAASWATLLNSVSRSGAHGSWRRAVLLAPVRAENPHANLELLSEVLLANDAELLRELIRTAMAVEIAPAAEVLRAVGFPVGLIPAGHTSPVIGVWGPLLMWILRNCDKLHGRAVVDVAEMIFNWCGGLLAIDPLSKLLLQRVYIWLLSLEERRRTFAFRATDSFVAGLEDHQIRDLEQSLRTTFVVFARSAPNLAAEYLNGQSLSGSRDRIVSEILRNPGTLAQAAPKELADLTARVLMKKADDAAEDEGRRDRPFGWVEIQFVPASPSQGPFLSLLRAEPLIALNLIRRLVDHAITFYFDGRPDDGPKLQIPLGSELRAFCWERSYRWSREGGPSPCVTSALMALEAWSHERLEGGASPAEVLRDILGSGAATPAAYLLIAVDVVLSHWPKTREAAIPFVASPELLCMDRVRAVHDQYEAPDFLGLKQLQKEPAGPVSVASLRRRPSRRLSLEVVLGNYALAGGNLRDVLRKLIQDAADRLGPPGPEDNFASPMFMARHAMSLTDPANWRKVQASEDSEQEGYVYVSPEEEVAHLRALQEASVAAEAEVGFEIGLESALDNPSRSSAELAARAVEWAQTKALEAINADATERRMRERSIVAAAALASRDATTEIRAVHQEWIRKTLEDALNAERDVGAAMRSGLSFNTLAIAFYGWAHNLSGAAQPIRGAKLLLEVASLSDPAGAHGFSASVQILDQIDPRLPRAILRVALKAAVRPARDWSDQKRQSQLDAAHKGGLEQAIDAEIRWFAGDCPEPAWPMFPIEEPHERRGFRIGKPTHGKSDKELRRAQRNEVLSTQVAALWVGAAAKLGIERGGWLREVVHQYWDWTFVSNGSNLKPDAEVEHRLEEWNRTFFQMAAIYGSGSDLFARATLDICALPDRSFFDVLTIYLRVVDDVYFNSVLLSASDESRARAAFAERMLKCPSWTRLRGDASPSIEMHIGPAIAVLFFNDYLPFVGSPPKCYLTPLGIDKIDADISTISRLSTDSPCPIVASVTLNLLEISPRVAHLKVAIDAVESWLEVFPEDTGFWIGSAFGRRACKVLQLSLRAGSPGRDAGTEELSRVSAVLSALVRVGVAEASALEKELFGKS